MVNLGEMSWLTNAFLLIVLIMSLGNAFVIGLAPEYVEGKERDTEGKGQEFFFYLNIFMGIIGSIFILFFTGINAYTQGIQKIECPSDYAMIILICFIVIYNSAATAYALNSPDLSETDKKYMIALNVTIAVVCIAGFFMIRWTKRRRMGLSGIFGNPKTRGTGWDLKDYDPDSTRLNWSGLSTYRPPVSRAPMSTAQPVSRAPMSTAQPVSRAPMSATTTSRAHPVANSSTAGGSGSGVTFGGISNIPPNDTAFSVSELHHTI